MSSERAVDAVISVGVARIDDVLPRAPAAIDAWLSMSERERCDGLGNDARRRQYLAGHWLLRELLAAMHAGTPIDCPLIERARQAPQVASDPSLSVSLSHSGDWVAAACARTPIGIDIEQRDAGRRLGGFEHLLLAEGETTGTLDEDELLQRWVVKEAQIKRHGGSALPRQLAALKLHRDDGGAANVLLFDNGCLYLGVAADGATSLQLDSEPAASPHSSWRVDGEVLRARGLMPA